MASKAAATTTAHHVHAAASAHEVHAAAAHAAHPGLGVGEVVEGGLVAFEMFMRLGLAVPDFVMPGVVMLDLAMFDLAMFDLMMFCLMVLGLVMFDSVFGALVVNGQVHHLAAARRIYAMHGQGCDFGSR
jgi:hypothetical protein